MTTTVAPIQLNLEQIKGVIPHRYPFLLLDRVTSLIPAEGKAVGFKNVSANDNFLQGHFPDMPIMPGVLQLEALAQLGGVLVGHTESGAGKIGLFTGLDNVRWRRMVTPGDRLDLEVELTYMRKSLVKMKGRASVEGQVTVEADMMFSLMPTASLA
jgi:3-hydroxyacyl-[acyl-carrier-protein] dehydratase